MAGFLIPGILFLATLTKPEQQFLKTVFAGARKAGYERFVEPAAGAFAMSHLARQVGFPAEAIDASDVSFFSAVMGYAIMGKPLDDLEIEVKGFPDVSDPATALYAHTLCRYLTQAHRNKKQKVLYWEQIVEHMKRNRDQMIQDLNGQLDRAKQTLHGMRYRSLDMFDHLDEYWQDERAVICLNPPTITKGFEKFYDTGGRVKWNEPTYRFFKPEDDLPKLADMALGAKALVLIYEEQEAGCTHLPPVFVRAGAIKAPGDLGPVRTINAYMTANRPDEVEALARGETSWTRTNALVLEKGEWRIMPLDHAITEKSSVRVVSMLPGEANYYRSIWTHKFEGGQAIGANLGVLIDGYLVGVMGFDPTWLRAGRFGNAADGTSMLLQYGMNIPDKRYRIGRLLNRLALTREVIAMFLTDLDQSKLESIRTNQMTPHPESKEMRGIMKMANRKKVGGIFHLTYQSPLRFEKAQEAFEVWLKDEIRYQTVSR